MSAGAIALMSPGRTSSGGSSFAANLAPVLADVTGREVRLVAVPARGRVPRPGPDCPDIVCLGSRAVREAGATTVFWPLNVAPLERHVARLAASSVRNRARHLALVARLGRSIDRADGLVFGSHHARSLYQARYPRAARLPYAVIPGGSPSGLPLVPRNPTQPPLVLVVSHLYPYKGIMEFVEAAAGVHRRAPGNVRFRVAGADRDPRYAHVVRRRVAELGLDRWLTIAPASPTELSALYAEATLAVFPSLCENAGSFALYDGLHAGTPTLCSDRSSMPEMVAGATRLVNPAQTSLLAREISALLSDPQGLTDLGDRALRWSSNAPSWSHRCDELSTFLANVKQGDN